METFTTRLNSVKDAYYGFIVAALTYVKKKPSRLEAVETFMNDNPNALTSDILGLAIYQLMVDIYKFSKFLYSGLLMALA